MGWKIWLAMFGSGVAPVGRSAIKIMRMTMSLSNMFPVCCGAVRFSIIRGMFVRCAVRSRGNPYDWDGNLGFRVVWAASPLGL